MKQPDDSWRGTAFDWACHLFIERDKGGWRDIEKVRERKR